jgi:hypothetical protein
VRGAQRSLYAIPAARFDELPRDLVAYRWKQLSRFPIADAHAIDFYYQPPSGDPVAIHAERGEDGWTSSPAFGEGKLDIALAALAHLRAEGIVADSLGDAELRALGLAPPNAILTVFGKASEEAAKGEDADGKSALPVLAEVHIGNVEGAEWIAARAAGDPVVYRLPYATAEQLPVSLESFRNRFEAAAPEAAAEPAPTPAPEAGEELLPAGEESP